MSKTKQFVEETEVRESSLFATKSVKTSVSSFPHIAVNCWDCKFFPSLK